MTSDTISIFGTLCTGLGLIALVLPLFLLSRLFKIEHDDFHDRWVKDGRPHGMPFWFPVKELQMLGFRSYPWFLGTWWLFTTPDWVKEHQTAPRLLMSYRLVSFILYIALCGWTLLVLYASSSSK